MKLLLLYVRRFLCLLLQYQLTENNIFKIFYENETLKMHNCSVHCRLLNFNGNVIYDNCIEAKLEAMQSSEIIKIDLNKYVKNDFYKKIFMQILSLLKITKQ